MNYLCTKTITNLMLSGAFIVVGYCLQWAGLATITSRMTSALQNITLVNFEWHLSMAVMIQMIFLGDIWWWDTVAHVFTAWAAGGLVVIAGLYRFLSIRLAALATIAFILGTFVLGAPANISERLVVTAGGKVYERSTVPHPIEERETYDAPMAPTVIDFWKAEDGTLPLGYIGFGFAWAAALFNVTRIALIPFITISLAICLFASLRRTRD
jgi:hypothetical protein